MAAMLPTSFRTGDQMQTHEIVERTLLHDAVVESLAQIGDVVTLVCSSVLVSEEGDGDPHRVIITLGGVSAIECDHAPAVTVVQEAADGGVLKFIRDGDVATLLMEWHRSAPRETITRLYTIYFRTFAIAAEREGAG